MSGTSPFWITPETVPATKILPMSRLTTSALPEANMLTSLNPMVGVIDGFRWAICGGEFAIYWPGFAASLAITVFFLWFGVRYFRKTERTFADVI